jgi:protein phosphatase
MALRVGVRSDVGRVRAKNEDASWTDPEGGLFIVADGLGGQQAGEVASRVAVEEIRRFLEAWSTAPVSARLLAEAVGFANETICSLSEDDPTLRDMGTTVVVSLIREGRLLLAHVGDSRAYLLDEAGLVRLTEDHSTVARWVREGQLTEEQARIHPHRGLVERCLGLQPFVQVDIRELPFKEGRLLLCTDGLTEMLRDDEIQEVLMAHEDPQAACDVLVAAANERGGLDNITVIVVQAPCPKATSEWV